VTWKDGRVYEVVNSSFIPLRINREKQEDLFKQYFVSWTPTIAILDAEGREHYRFTGFLSPLELCARIMLDEAKVEFNRDSYDLATKRLDEVLEKYQGTFAVPEAIFYLGVVQYISSHEPKFLRQGFDRLTKDFPDSEWTLRAKPYELINV
jgi:hypothetical protein